MNKIKEIEEKLKEKMPFTMGVISEKLGEMRYVAFMEEIQSLIEEERADIFEKINLTLRLSRLPIEIGKKLTKFEDGKCYVIDEVRNAINKLNNK